MNKQEFNAFIVDQRDGRFAGHVGKRRIEDLPEGDLLVKVEYSSLNYKDALSATGNKGVTRSYPHTPGIDAAGTVVRSENSLFSPGDKVIVTSYDLGMNTDGGFAEYIQVPSQWAVKLPDELTLREAMIYGTAGLTAGMSILRLAELVKPDDGNVIVSGATGGVGIVSIAILCKLGYSVTAVTGKESEKDYLTGLGVKEVVLRPDFEALDKKPLLKPEYAGAVDTVGGIILENILKSVTPMGVVTCCGNVASGNLELTVYPFILRGISLIGIDSQNCPMDIRETVWMKLAQNWKPAILQNLCHEISLEDVPQRIASMLKGNSKGRTVIRLGKY